MSLVGEWRALQSELPAGWAQAGLRLEVTDAATADRDRLLADRHVQEPGQVTGSELLLDLLLEAPDQQHLAQKLTQALLG